MGLKQSYSYNYLINKAHIYKYYFKLMNNSLLIVINVSRIIKFNLLFHFRYEKYYFIYRIEIKIIIFFTSNVRK